MVKYLPAIRRFFNSSPSCAFRRRASLGAIVTAAALLAAACGGSSPTTTTSSGKPLAVAGIEHAIKLSIVKEHNITTTVRCPANVPAQKGYTFTCNAALDVGVYPVNVLEVNTVGGVSYSNSTPLRVLSSHSVESAIVAAIRRERHLKSKVTCPATILQQQGVKFTCSATTKKGTGPFTVTETDGRGHVTFVGH